MTPEPAPEPRRLWLLIAAVTVIGAGLRLATAPSFDFYGDEFWTLQWSQVSLKEIFSTFDLGLTMHLYILFIKAWMLVVGFSPLMVKLPSLIAGLALIPLVFSIGKKCLDPHSALLAAVLVALNFQMILHSRTARVYTILALAVLASMWLFVRALRSGSHRDLLFLSLLNAGLLALSLHSLYVLGVQGVALVLEILSRRLPLRRLAPTASGIALSLGLAVLFYHRAFAGLGKVADLAGVTKPEAITVLPWLPVEKLWHPFSTNHLIAPWLMLPLLAVGAWIAWRRHRLPGRLLVLWAVLPSIVYFLQRSQLPSGSISRYVLPALPAQLLLIALGGLFLLRRLLPGSIAKWSLGLATLLLAAGTFSNSEYNRQLVLQREPMAQAMRRIVEIAEPGDFVTSFLERYHAFFKLHLGDAAVPLPTVRYKQAIPEPRRVIILTRQLPLAAWWWRQYFEIEVVSAPRYLWDFHLLTSRRMPAGPNVLRSSVEQFYLGFLSAVMRGARLHPQPHIHDKYLSRIHDHLADLNRAAGNEEESAEHRLLERNPQAWNGDMTSYPLLMARLRAGPVPITTVTVRAPSVAATLFPEDTLTLKWITKNGDPSDDMVLAMKRDSVPPTVFEPDGVNWIRFGESTPNDGAETVVVPGAAARADDWRFFVRHAPTGTYNFTYVNFVVADPGGEPPAGAGDSPGD